MADTRYIDLDAVDLPKQLVVKLGGKEHHLVPVTVESFVANTKALQQLGKNGEGDFEKEVEIVTAVLLRAFPTMTREMLDKMALANLNKLMTAAQAEDGTDSVNDAVKVEVETAASANPPKAAA